MYYVLFSFSGIYRCFHETLNETSKNPKNRVSNTYIKIPPIHV